MSSFPGFADAMLRLYTAYKEEQFALADQRQVALTKRAMRDRIPLRTCGGSWRPGELFSEPRCGG